MNLKINQNVRCVDLVNIKINLMLRVSHAKRAQQTRTLLMIANIHLTMNLKKIVSNVRMENLRLK